MELLILLFALLLLWLYISWDSDRISAQARIEVGERPKGTAFLPTVLITVSALLVAAAALAATAVLLVLQPPMPPFVGRGSWITALIHSTLGRYGPAVVITALALVCLASALACIRKRHN